MNIKPGAATYKCFHKLPLHASVWNVAQRSLIMKSLRYVLAATV
jgi:hypothetical protein